MSIIIRLQNLPWDANALNIRQFFYGLSIPDGGVHIIGGDKGDAFIAFSSDEDARIAMRNDMLFINTSQIKLYLSSKTEMQNVIAAARGGGGAGAPPPTKEPTPYERQQQSNQNSGGNFMYPAKPITGGENVGLMGPQMGSRFGAGGDFRQEPVQSMKQPLNDQRPALLGNFGGSPPGMHGQGPPSGMHGQGPPPGMHGQVDRPYDMGGKSMMDSRPSLLGDGLSAGRGFGGQMDSGYPLGNNGTRGIQSGNMTMQSGPWSGGPAGPREPPSRQPDEFVDPYSKRPPVDHTRIDVVPRDVGKGNFNRDAGDWDRTNFEDVRNYPGQQFPRPVDDRREFPRPGDDRREFPQPGDDRRAFPRPGDDRRDFPRPGDDRRDFPRPGDDRRDFTRPGEDRRDFPKPDDRRDFQRPPEMNPDFNRPETDGRFTRPGVDRGLQNVELSRDFSRQTELPNFRGERIGDNFVRGPPPRAMDSGFPRNEPSMFHDQRLPFEAPPVRGPGPNFPGHFSQPPGMDRWRGNAPGMEQVDRFVSNRSPPRDFRQPSFPGFNRPSEEWPARDQRSAPIEPPRGSLCIHVSNLPVSYNYREVRRFFRGCEIPNDGLKIINDRDGRRSGVAYIQLSTPNHVANALTNDGQKASDNTVVVKQCSQEEYDKAVDSYQPARGGRDRERSRSPVHRRSSDRSERKPDLCIVIKKMPARFDKTDLKKFLGSLRTARDGGPFVELGKDGRVTGNALAEFDKRKDFDDAIALHKTNYRGTVVDVIAISKREFDDRSASARKSKADVSSNADKVDSKSDKNDGRSSRGEAKSKDADSKTGNSGDSETSDKKYQCIEVSGLSWPSTNETLIDFFKGINIAPDGIHLVLNSEGKAAGKAYIEFASLADCAKATARNKQYLGKRYLEIKGISKAFMLDEFRRQQKLHGGKESVSSAVPANREEVPVYMKNLNSRTQLEDILEFFHGFRPIADSIKLQYKDDRPTGDGLAVFSSKKEAESAINKLNRKMLLGKQIELGLNR